jgi:phage terminase small subunit
MADTDHYALLTEMQKNFVEYFLGCLNATEAAAKAGYSAKSARAKGSQLLANVNVAAVIKQRRKEKLSEISLEQNRVIEEVAAIAFANFFDVAVVGDDGELTYRKPEDILPHAHKAIKKIVPISRTTTTNQGETVVKSIQIELWDKMRALEFLGRYFGMTDGKGGDNESGGNSGDSEARAQRILDAARRIAGGRQQSAAAG